MNVKLKGFKELEKAIARNPVVVKEEAKKFFVRSNRELMSTINRNPWTIGGIGGGVPVATGNLRTKGHSTKYEPFKMSIIVNTNAVKYAEFVHEGTKYMKERPWLDYALKKNKKKIDSLEDDMIKNITNNLTK